MTIELIEPKTKIAMRNYKPALPLHNEPIIDAFQNDESEIVINVISGSGIKTYSLAASEYDVFTWYWGDGSTNGVVIKEVLNGEIYIMYAEHFRKDWEEVKE